MQKFLLILSWIAVLALWACAGSVYLSPAHYGWLLGVVGLCFPFGVAAVLGTALLCLLLKPKLLWVHLLGLGACAGSLRDYCPLNLSSPPPKGCLKVMTYNTMNWGSRERDERGDYEVVRYVGTQRPDLACLQEAIFYGTEDQDAVVASLRRYGYHYHWLALSSMNIVGLASRYPIVDKEIICRSKTNGAAAFYVIPKRGDTLIVVNAHLESMHLSAENRHNFSQIVKNPDEAEAIGGKRAIISTIGHSGHDRALQADTLAQFLDRHKGRKVIVMGDFNDTPISYAHHQVCERLTDAFRATGNGIGRSFHKDAIYVRIDNIFCSPHWKPYAARVDASVPFSDHYPLTAYLKPL